MTRDAFLQGIKRYFLRPIKYFILERIVYASIRAWMLRLAFLSLLLSWAFVLHVVKSRHISLIDVTFGLDVTAFLDIIKVGHAEDTIRFGVWGVCNGEAEVSTLLGKFHIPATCTPHRVGKIHFNTKVADILHLRDAVHVADMVEDILAAFVELHPASVAMGVVGWVMSMCRPRIFKWRTRTIMRLPTPEWAIFFSATGLIFTVILSVYFHYIELADHLELKGLKVHFDVLSVEASVAIHEGEGNAKKWDHLAMCCFCIATVIYSLCLLGRRRWRWVAWLRRLAPGRDPIPVVQVDELSPFTFIRRRRESPQLAELTTGTSTGWPDPESQEAHELRAASTFQSVDYDEKYVVSPIVEK